MFKGHSCAGASLRPGWRAPCSVGYQVIAGLVNLHRLTLHPVTFPLCSYNCLEWEAEAISRWLSHAQGTSSTGRAHPPVGGLCSRPPPAAGHAWRRLFRRCADVTVVFLPCGEWDPPARCLHGTRDRICDHGTRTQGITWKHEELPFHELTPHSSTVLVLVIAPFHYRGDPSSVRPKVCTIGE